MLSSTALGSVVHTSTEHTEKATSVSVQSLSDSVIPHTQNWCQGSAKPPPHSLLKAVLDFEAFK